MTHAALNDYLADGETIERSWHGSLSVEDDDPPSWLSQDDGAEFAATDDRIMYVDGDGGFKDIDFKHISSVEAEKSEEPEPSLQQVIFFGGIIGGFVGLFLLFDGQMSGLLLMLAGLGATGLTAMGEEGIEELMEMETNTNYTIRLITGDEAHSEIKFQTEENIGADLSRIVRENGSD